jgi:hypothetical protein
MSPPHAKPGVPASRLSILLGRCLSTRPGRRRICSVQTAALSVASAWSYRSCTAIGRHPPSYGSTNLRLYDPPVIDGAMNGTALRPVTSNRCSPQHFQPAISSNGYRRTVLISTQSKQAFAKLKALRPIGTCSGMPGKGAPAGRPPRSADLEEAARVKKPHHFRSREQIAGP